MTFGDVEFYHLIERKGKYDLSFGESPVMPIGTRGFKEILIKLDVDDVITIHSKDCCTESDYKIVWWEIMQSEIYRQGVLVIYVERSSYNMRVWPGFENRGPIKPKTDDIAGLNPKPIFPYKKLSNDEAAKTGIPGLGQKWSL